MSSKRKKSPAVTPPEGPFLPPYETYYFRFNNLERTLKIIPSELVKTLMETLATYRGCIVGYQSTNITDEHGNKVGRTVVLELKRLMEEKQFLRDYAKAVPIMEADLTVHQRYRKTFDVEQVYLTTFNGTMSPNAITNYVTEAFLEVTVIKGKSERQIAMNHTIVLYLPHFSYFT